MGIFDFLRHKDTAQDRSIYEGSQVLVFRGRKPVTGVVEEIQDDGQLVVFLKGGLRLVKTPEEVQLAPGMRDDLSSARAKRAAFVQDRIRMEREERKAIEEEDRKRALLEAQREQLE